MAKTKPYKSVPEIKEFYKTKQKKNESKGIQNLEDLNVKSV